ncbi:MAG: transposase [Bacteroidota bacterium]
MGKIRYEKIKRIANGGVWHVLNYLKRRQFKKFVNDKFPSRRGKNAKYSYFDAICQMFVTCLNKDKRIADTEKIRKSKFETTYYNKSIGHDTVGLLVKSLAVPNDVVKTDYIQTLKNGMKEVKVSVQQTNINNFLNNTLIETAMQFGYLVKGAEYVLDIDATVLETKKKDATITYKMRSGYHPMVVFLNGVPVWIEGRNGNTHAKYDIYNALKSAIEKIESYGLRISKVRIDSAGFNLGIMKYLHATGKKFFIRLVRNQKENEKIYKLLDDGQRLPLILMRDFYGDTYKCVYTKKKGTRLDKKVEPKLFGVVTNDINMSAEKILDSYNQRALCEQSFCELKNFFNWHAVPFINMNENIAYLHVCSMMYIMYKSMVKDISIISLKNACSDIVTETMQLKAFHAKFMTVFARGKNDTYTFEIDDLALKRLFVLLEKVLNQKMVIKGRDYLEGWDNIVCRT